MPLSNNCHGVGGFTIMHICALLPWMHVFPSESRAERSGRREGLLCREDAVCCVLLLLCSRARDTFSVITCRRVSMENQGFSHCFLSGLIWWMLSGTQHVSLETSWKSGGHWRHLKGLSEASLCCPCNVFRWACWSCFLFFSPPSFSAFLFVSS